jgi:hypothetical protein
MHTSTHTEGEDALNTYLLPFLQKNLVEEYLLSGLRNQFKQTNLKLPQKLLTFISYGNILSL